MTPRTSPEVLFHDARAIVDPRERAAFLERACGGDQPLRKRVEALLRADSNAAGFLERAGGEASPHGGVNALGLEQPGERIDRYRLLEWIGEGGFGSVWMAEQLEPVKRRVALKILKLGLDTKAVVARFEAERQALALMDHPNIAHVFDGGATHTGRPYFVMELVKGVPITQYCDDARMGLRERLGLFVEVCAALQHAHHKGVVHRDVKPSNVLVTLQDGRALPKVIDFGIAKATGAELTEKTLFTSFHQMIGTPDYMAPEQAAGNLDIDTRADVYSLGVLLYELLTGTKPLDLRAATNGGVADLVHAIREVEPQRPSTRASTADEHVQRAALQRALGPRELSAHLRGDLDWIVLKTLEKDRARRYDTAAALADDIGRYLRDEPVLATPPSKRYLLGKYVRRHKVTVVAGASIALALIGGVAASTSFAFRAEQRRVDAERARGEADSARTSAEASAERAQRAEREAFAALERAQSAERETAERARDLEEVVAFQEHQIAQIDAESVGLRLRESLFEQRRANAARGGATEDDVARELAALQTELRSANFTTLAVDSLDESIFEPTRRAIDEQFAAQPAVRARLLERLARSLSNVGRFEQASAVRATVSKLREEELGPEHELTLRARLDLLSEQVGTLADSDRERELEELTGVSRRVFGPDHDLELGALAALGKLRAYRGEHERSALDFEAAIAGWTRRGELDSEPAIHARANLGSEWISLRRVAEGAEVLEDAIADFRRVLGPDDVRVLPAVHSLCTAWMMLGRTDDALAELRSSLAGARRKQGDDHTVTLGLLDNLAGNLLNVGRIDEAEPLFVELVERLRRVPGTGDVELHFALARFGRLRSSQRRHDEAIELLREGYDGLSKLVPREHAALTACAHNLGTALYNVRRPQEALAYLQHAYDGRRATLGLDSVETATTAQALASALHGLQRTEEAFEVYRPAVDALEKALGPDHERVSRAWRNLGVLALACRDFEAAAKAFQRSSDALRRQGLQGGAEMHSDLGFLASSLLELERWPQAEPVIAECAELRERLAPADSWVHAHTRSLSGTLLLRQGRLEQARPLLVESAEQLLAARELTPPRIGQPDRAADACERTAQLFEALQTGEPSPENHAQLNLWRERAATRRSAAQR